MCIYVSVSRSLARSMWRECEHCVSRARSAIHTDINIIFMEAANAVRLTDCCCCCCCYGYSIVYAHWFANTVFYVFIYVVNLIYMMVCACACAACVHVCNVYVCLPFSLSLSRSLFSILYNICSSHVCIRNECSPFARAMKSRCTYA